MFELLLMIFLVPVFTVIFLLLRFGLYLLKLSAKGCLWIVRTVLRLGWQFLVWVWHKIYRAYRSRHPVTYQ